MTESKPPEYYFNGIIFNTQYFKESTELLTQDEADDRYLIKTQPDTTTSLQTFSAGLNFSGILDGGTIECTAIKTNTYQSETINAALTLGNNQIGVNAVIDIGCNVGRIGNINIANTQTTGTSNIVIGSNLLTTGTQNITINQPLTIGYTVNPVGLSKIGGSTSVTASQQPFTGTGGSITLTVLNNIPIGVYQVFYNITTTITVANAAFTERITTISDRTNDTQLANVFNFMINSDLQPEGRSIGINFTISGGGLFVNTIANESIYLNQRYIFTAGPTINSIGHLRIVRIG